MYNSANSYNLLGGARDDNSGPDNDIEIGHESGGSEISDDNSGWLEFRNRKRTRKNTGGASGHAIQTDPAISKREYEKLSVDEKLSVLFTSFNTKMLSLDQKVSDCVKIHKQVEQVETQLSDHEKRLKLLEYKSLDLESRSRRNNLIIGGISEGVGEDCFLTVSDFLRDKLQVTPCPPMPRAHRLGRFTRGKTRPIIVYFLDTRDTEFVLSRANRLKGSSISINRDFPKEIAAARKSLWPEYKQLRDANPKGKVKLVYPAKLVKEGRIVKDMFPLWDLIMQGNRVISHKQMFTNTADPNTQDMSTRNLCSNSHAQPVHTNSPSRDNTTSNNRPRDKNVNHQTRNNNTHSNNDTRGQSSRRVQSTSPGRSGRGRRRARTRGRSQAHHRRNPSTSNASSVDISSSQPAPIGHRPWVTENRHRLVAASDHGVESTNL